MEGIPAGYPAWNAGGDLQFTFKRGNSLAYSSPLSDYPFMKDIARIEYQRL
jgi:hypothetical protein